MYIISLVHPRAQTADVGGPRPGRPNDLAAAAGLLYNARIACSECSLFRPHEISKWPLQEFSADLNSRPVKRIEDVMRLRTAQFVEDAGSMAHPIRPDSYIKMDNFYTLTVYEKGAEIVRLYQTLLGKDGFRSVLPLFIIVETLHELWMYHASFLPWERSMVMCAGSVHRKGMDLYFKRHDGQAVTCDDFRNAMADANGQDLSAFAAWCALLFSVIPPYFCMSLRLHVYCIEDCHSIATAMGAENKGFVLSGTHKRVRRMSRSQHHTMLPTGHTL